MPEFVKYIGVEFPKTHLNIYCNKMNEVIKDYKLHIHYFYESLSGATLTWYMNLNENKINKYRDLTKAFMR